MLIIGYVKGVVGIKGDIKVVYDKSFTNSLKFEPKRPLFFDIDQVWIDSPSFNFCSRVVSVAQRKNFFRLELEKINNRKTAESIIGSYLRVNKNIVPAISQAGIKDLGLLNFTIINLKGTILGEVDKIDGNSFHDWIFSGRIVIPLVEKHIKKIDLKKKQILVDWEDFW